MDNDIEKIRQRWRSLDIEAPAGAKAPGRSNGRLPHTEKQRIMVRLRLMALILTGAMLYYIIFMLEFHTPLWLNIYYEGFMVLAIGLQIWQLIKLKRLRLVEMSTIDAIDAIKRMMKMRMWAKALLISLAVPLVVLLVWVLGEHADPELFHGIVSDAIIGGVLGGLIGWLIDRRFRKDFRAMIEQLEGSDDEEIQ